MWLLAHTRFLHGLLRERKPLVDWYPKTYVLVVVVVIVIVVAVIIIIIIVILSLILFSSLVFPPVSSLSLTFSFLFSFFFFLLYFFLFIVLFSLFFFLPLFYFILGDITYYASSPSIYTDAFTYRRLCCHFRKWRGKKIEAEVNFYDLIYFYFFVFIDFFRKIFLIFIWIFFAVFLLLEAWCPSSVALYT